MRAVRLIVVAIIFVQESAPEFHFEHLQLLERICRRLLTHSMSVSKLAETALLKTPDIRASHHKSCRCACSKPLHKGIGEIQICEGNNCPIIVRRFFGIVLLITTPTIA
jgi:hypothetical protein